MSTPVPAATQPLSWLQKHERLILGTMVLAVVLFLGNRWFDKSAADADARAAAAVQVVAVQDAASKQLAAQATQQVALLTQQIAADKQEMTSLVELVASRDAASTTKVTSVSGSKTPTQAVADLSTEYTLAAPVTTTADGADIPTVDIQQFTVAKIEGDTAAADLKDTVSELHISQGDLTSCQGVVSTLQKQVAQDVTDLKAHDDAAAKDLKAAKAEARKSKFKIFWYGFVAGFVGRSVIK
jgi:hypothetical protein